MDLNSFFVRGAEVEIRRIDEVGDSLFAVVTGARAGKVALAWRDGQAPSEQPRPGTMIRVIRDDDMGKQFAVTVAVEKPLGGQLIAIPRTKPAKYNRRAYLRVEAPLSMRYRLVDEAEAFQLRKEIEARGAPPAAGRTRTGTRLDRRTRSRSIAPEGGGILLPPELTRQLDRLEEKLDRILDQLGAPREVGGAGLGPRQVRQVDISGSGMRFRIDDEAPSGSILEVDLLLPIAPPVAVLTLVEVVRCARAGSEPEKGRWIMAGRYDTIHEDDRAAIVRYTFDRQRELEKAAAEE